MVTVKKIVREYRSKDSDDYTDKHPAFAQVRISRITRGGVGKGTRLYGSPLRYHPMTIGFEIAPSERIHHLSEDSYFGANKPYISIEMTASQFADLLTGINMGTGVCCTLKGFDGHRISPIPVEDEMEIDRIESGFKENLTKRAMDIAKVRDDVHRMLDKRSLNKGDRIAVKAFVDKVYNFFLDGAPFIMEQFSEATDKIKDSVKKDVDAFVHAMVVSTGMKHIEKLLEDGGSKEEQ